MTYRNDLDALAAREAVLAKELEAKATERDEVARMLDEAKVREAALQREQDIASGRRRRRFVRILVAIVVALVAVAVALAVRAKREATQVRGAPHVYTCEQIAPYYRHLQQLAAQSYAIALTAKGLVPAQLQVVEIGGGWPGGPETREELDQLLGQHAEPWTTIDYQHDGKRRRALVGEVEEPSYVTFERAQFELVIDARGGVWRVVRAPRRYTAKTVDVDACPGWGCFGQPPPGAMPPQILSRKLWLLPAGATYRGTVEISYDAPQLEMNNLKDDSTGECSPPG